MIRQTCLSSAATPDGKPDSNSPEPFGHWAGTGVTLVSGVRSLFKSLDPRYVPEHLQQSGQQVEYPSFSNAPAGQNNDFFQGVELATRLMSHALLPEEVRLFMGVVNLSAAVRLISSTLDTPESNARPEPAVPVNVDTAQDKNRDQQPARKKTARTQPGSPHQDSQLARTAVSLGVLASLAHAGANPLAGNPFETVKDIGDAEALARIGRDSGYPLNGTYVQTNDIDAGNLRQSIGNASHPFTGRYDGQCHTIKNLNNCLVKKLNDGGSIRNLRFADARINATEITGVVACEVNGKVSDISVEHAQVLTWGDDAYAGIGGGRIANGGTVKHIEVVNSKVTTWGERAYAGIGGGGIANGGTVEHIEVVNSKVTTWGERAYAGIGGGSIGGSIDEGGVEHIKVVNSKVTTWGERAYAGIGGGYIPDGGTVEHTRALNCNVTTWGDEASAGIGGGAIGEWLKTAGGKVKNTTAVNCKVTGHGNKLGAGIGGGGIEREGTVEHTRALNCSVTTEGSGSSHAGIGGGHIGKLSTVEHTRAVNCNVTTSGAGAYAGIGGGWAQGPVTHTVAVNCNVTTTGAGAYAGIGGGLNSSPLTHTAAVNCHVTTSGFAAHAGIGGGDVDSFVKHTTAVNCHVTTSGTAAGAGIGKGHPPPPGTVEHTKVVNSTVNGEVINIGNIPSDVCPGNGDEPLLLTGDSPASHAYPDASRIRDIVSTVQPGNRSALPGVRPVDNAETLFKIGWHDDYPLNGTYLQTADIDARNQTHSIGNATHPFTGQYDGQCHTIENPKHCFVKTLATAGSIRNLRFADARITSTESTGVVACEVKGTVSDIYVEHADVLTTGDHAYAGIGGGWIDNDGTVERIAAVHSEVTTRGQYACAGIGGGWIGSDGNVEDTIAVNSKVTTSGANAGGGIGGGWIASDGNVKGTIAVNSKVTTEGQYAHAGIGGGQIASDGNVEATMAVNSMVTTEGQYANAGIGGGIANGGKIAEIMAVDSKVNTWGQYAQAGIGGGLANDGKVAETTAVNSMVTSRGQYANAGIGGGWIVRDGNVENTTAVNSKVTTWGQYANAGIGGGAAASNGTVAETAAVNSMVTSRGQYGHAGIGGGQVGNDGKVAETTAVSSEVTTWGQYANAGIGGGWIASDGNVEETTVENSMVTTWGQYANAGVGGGRIASNGTVEDTTVVSSKVTSRGQYAQAGIGGGRIDSDGNAADILAVNSTVNGNLKNIRHISSDADLCNSAAPRVLTGDCQSSNAACPAGSLPAVAGTAPTLAAGWWSTAGIAIGAMGGTAIAAYLTCQWLSGYREGLRGQALALRPFTRGGISREAASDESVEEPAAATPLALNTLGPNNVNSK